MLEAENDYDTYDEEILLCLLLYTVPNSLKNMIRMTLIKIKSQLRNLKITTKKKNLLSLFITRVFIFYAMIAIVKVHEWLTMHCS